MYARRSCILGQIALFWFEGELWGLYYLQQTSLIVISRHQSLLIIVNHYLLVSQMNPSLSQQHRIVSSADLEPYLKIH